MYFTKPMEEALLVELQANWKWVNQTLFSGVLRPPALTLHDGQAHLARWHNVTRTLSFSRGWVSTANWGAVIEVLKHEMAHQYTFEVCKVTHEVAHGPTFQEVCKRFNIDGRAAGVPAHMAGPPPKWVARIQKLLSLAKSTNEHEAHSAMAKAMRLMTEHQVKWSELGPPEPFHFRQIGPAKGRFSSWEKALAGLLAAHFGVLAIWVPVYDVQGQRRVRALEINGRTTHLDVAEYVHTFLTEASNRLWNTYKKDNGLRRNKERQSFLLGVMMGVDQRLTEETQRCQKEGLIIVKDAELTQWFGQRHRSIRRRRGQPILRTSALTEGKKAGEKLPIRKGLQVSLRNLLPLLTQKH